MDHPKVWTFQKATRLLDNPKKLKWFDELVRRKIFIMNILSSRDIEVQFLNIYISRVLNNSLISISTSLSIGPFLKTLMVIGQREGYISLII